MKDNLKKFIAVGLIVISSVIFDQGTKYWAEENLASMHYSDHQIEVTVAPEQAGVTLEQFVKTNYDSLNERDQLRVASSASRDGKRMNTHDPVNENDKLAFNYMPKTVIDGYFDFQYARNQGAAWSLFADQSPTFRKWFFGATGILALFALSVFIGVSEWKKQKFLIITLACIMGGALGNIIDRFRLSYVTDFISWHIRDSYYYPTFNIADVFVCVGVGLLIIDVIIHRKDEDPKKSKDPKKIEGSDNAEKTEQVA